MNMKMNKMTSFEPSDIRVSTIKELFYRQISSLTLQTGRERERTFDMQFSDCWL